MRGRRERHLQRVVLVDVGGEERRLRPGPSAPTLTADSTSSASLTARVTRASSTP